MHRLVAALTASLSCLAGSAATAQPVTVAELEGATVTYRIVRKETVLRGGVTYSGQVQSDVRLVFGPSGTIHAKRRYQWSSPRGTMPAKFITGSAQIGHPKETTRNGGGNVLVVLIDGTLTFMHAFKKGGYKLTINFLRTPQGISCTCEEAYLREKGVNGIFLRSTQDSALVQILNYRQASSACRVIPRATSVRDKR
jgi:hypothetical protein